MIDDERMADELRTFYEEEPVVRPDRIRMTHDVLDEIHGKLPGRRTRWWLPSFRRTPSPPPAMPGTEYQPTSIPATNGHTPTVLGRTHSMFSPVKAIAAGALVFALGGMFLIAQPFEQQGNVPGAATEDGVAVPVEFTAKWAFGGSLRPQTTEVVDGVTMTSGGAWRPGVITEASDPRLQGTLSIAANNNRYGVAGLTLWNEAFRIENDQGAWQQMPSIDIDTGEGDLNTTSGVLVGEGGYAGLIAVFDKLSENSSWTLHGYIIDGELPPAPEPYVTG